MRQQIEKTEIAKISVERMVSRRPDGTEAPPFVLRSQVASGHIGARPFDAGYATNGDLVVYVHDWRGQPGQMFSVGLGATMEAIVAFVAGADRTPPTEADRTPLRDAIETLDNLGLVVADLLTGAQRAVTESDREQLVLALSEMAKLIDAARAKLG